MNNEEGHELRLVAKSSQPNLKNFTLEGQIASMKLSTDVKIGGVFSLAEEESALGIQTAYAINKYVGISVAGKLNNLKALGGEVLVNVNIPYKNHVVMPFIKTDHKILTEVGLVYYFKLDNTDFHVGASLSPSFLEEKEFKIEGLSFFAGASIYAGSKILKDLKGLEEGA